MEFKNHDYYVGNKVKDVLFGYTKRTNGFSSYPANSFNMALYIGDDESNVHHHQELLASTINFGTAGWVMPIQRHGGNIKEVTRDDCGKNITALSDDLYDIDGLYTYDTDLLLTMNYADCVPVYVYSTVNSFTALVHAGWRGTSKSVLLNLLNEYDGPAGDLIVIIGVAINGGDYMVDDKVIGTLADDELTGAVAKVDSGYNLDLKMVNKNQAKKFGIPPANIYITPLGTEDTDTFFSFRLEDGRIGRALAFIGRQSDD